MSGWNNAVLGETTDRNGGYDPRTNMFAALSAAPVMLWASDEQGNMVCVNEHWLRFHGRDITDELGEGWTRQIHPEDRGPFLSAYTRSLNARAPFEARYRTRDAQGAFHWVINRAEPRFDGDAFAGYAGCCIEIDAPVPAGGQAAVDTPFGFRHLAEAIPALVLMTSEDGEVEFCNSRLLDYCGADVAAFQGARWVDYIHPEDVRIGRDAWLKQISEAKPFASEYRIRRADGLYRWHLNHTAPLRDAFQRTYGWVAVSIDVDDRHKAEDDALKVAEELHRASAAKDEFLGLVSHELRTPITTIYGNAQVLRRTVGQLDVDTLSLSLGDIEQEALRLQQLIDNMFVLARVDAGVPMLTEPVLLSRIVDKVVRDQHHHVPGRAITVDDQLGTDPVAGEELYIEQIIRNLLSNANKYGAPNHPIVVSIARSGVSGAVRVRNRGRTPSDDEMAQMFEAFYRSPTSADHIPGAGIGLAVCKRLTEAMGGEIWLRPQDQDGLEAGFSLPLETEAL